MSKKPELRGRAARLAQLLPHGRNQAARTPFVLLVVLLLGGGLITLLILNSSLNEGSFQVSELKRQTKDLTEEKQQLQRDVDGYAAPDALQRRADKLGMVPGGDPAFLDPDGTVRGVPGAAAARPSALRPQEAASPVASVPISAPPPAAASAPAATAPGPASVPLPPAPPQSVPPTPVPLASAPSAAVPPATPHPAQPGPPTTSGR
ncbi:MULTISPECIES: septum formation initiator family protein [Streptomyces]|uniref:septum formation initiator family protein n=1 Tax=Streptomyces TaxID=1883 RepID=UPI001E4460C8|nr:MULTISPECIES: septum formation initiator family protein [Streptomyces]UFQ15120.1 septum formation initiator family protein [Streptomyces huasconensis]WCL84727.1 septum formation initiator family protein [Streptomyces sp. JCM 35825]